MRRCVSRLCRDFPASDNAPGFRSPASARQYRRLIHRQARQSQPDDKSAPTRTSSSAPDNAACCGSKRRSRPGAYPRYDFPAQRLISMFFGVCEGKRLVLFKWLIYISGNRVELLAVFTRHFSTPAFIQINANIHLVVKGRVVKLFGCRLPLAHYRGTGPSLIHPAKVHSPENSTAAYLFLNGQCSGGYTFNVSSARL